MVDAPNEDFDDDGFSEVEGDVYPDGSSADNDDEVYPGAIDICDGLVDEDPINPAQDAILLYVDEDGDGFGVL